MLDFFVFFRVRREPRGLKEDQEDLGKRFVY